jgi:hypothetical protein
MLVPLMVVVERGMGLALADRGLRTNTVAFAFNVVELVVEPLAVLGEAYMLVKGMVGSFWKMCLEEMVAGE